MKRKTSILRKINPSDCSYRTLGNQNLYLHWGMFAENFPEEILDRLNTTGSKKEGLKTRGGLTEEVIIRRSHLYSEETMYDQKRIGLGSKPFHLVDFYDIPDGKFGIQTLN